MANRCTLHHNHLDAFAKWLEENGWTLEPTKGTFELLRARRPDRQRPLIIYNKMNAKEHCSVDTRDYHIVGKFIKSIQKSKIPPKEAPDAQTKRHG